MSSASDLLAPGVRRMRPDDHFMVLSETDASPMHVGALLMLEVPQAQKAGLAAAFRRQLAERLPATPLLVRLFQSPEGFDSDVWVDVAGADLDRLVMAEDMPLADDAALYAAVAERNMIRLDLTSPPFLAYVFTGLRDDRAAIYFKMHHCVADGIGFQEVLRLLSDEAPPVPPRTADATLPGEDEWRRIAEARFAAEEGLRGAQSATRKQALAALEPLAGERAATPALDLGGATSNRRSYTTVSIPLEPFKAVAGRLGATVNDLFLACASHGLHDVLASESALPAEPLVVNTARSYRRAEHGSFGNRIVAMHPHLATNLSDPIARLHAIQASMRSEMRRTAYDEALLDALEKPFGARDRRATFARLHGSGGRVLPGNVTLSNVPGPAAERRFMGWRQLHNFPVPIIGSGRFANITSRRSGANLDMGVITDAAKIAEARAIARGFEEGFAQYAALGNNQTSIED
ncbi:wax ester/triacylglycerol synthase domain-containing protein [Novosphingobium tardum]|uniref:diacylglycerol O-acyltransferase n=1 Tax=Novosphingobium tardum TaxID=1538021 RepID=A0ABV8RR26_9SPHN